MDPVPDSAWLQAAMEVPVTASLGPMAAVLRQLHSEHCRPEGVSKAKIQSLLRCLGGLCITLKDLSDQVHEPSFTALCWMKEVRELCFDTQDYFDEVSPAASDEAARIVGARLSSITWFHRRPQTDIARDFLEIRARVEDASKRRRRLQLGATSSKPPETESGQAGVSQRGMPRLRTQLLEEPMDDLVRLLDFDDKKEKRLKVITIFGFPGVGKTTVANTMYHKHGCKFQCRAFVRVTRNPNTRKLLNSILSQIKAPPPPGFPDVQDLIDIIKMHLQGKRYLIILDNLWASATWDIISCAFPHGDCRSRIITTTEIKDVALACSRPHLEHKYDISPLKPEQSKQLFFSTVFGPGGHCPQDFKDVSDTIISKCGGLPLVIACVGSLLASKIDLVLGEWKLLSDSLPSSLMINPTHDGMKEFVNFMYNALPSYLKTCLLYLSMYPEGCIVWKDDLVNQWVAEGFIGTEENARLYFDDLVSRGMVQAVNINCDGEVLSCTVHHIVLDLIRHKSMVQNFIVIVGTSPAIAGLPDKVRRLSVQFGSAKCANIPTGFRISQARSYVYFGYIDCVLSIEKYKLLRVLILHTWSDQDKNPLDLTRLGELFLLRYLKVQCNITVQLPEEMQGLQYLETLHVDAKIASAPSDILHLEKLLHLRLPTECVLPDGFARLTSLRTLGHFDLGSHSEDIVMDLAKLTNLQDIQLTCSTLQLAENQENNVKLIFSILENLRGLRSVTLEPTTGSSAVRIPCIVSPPLALTLQRIQLSWRCCIFSSIPQWFGKLRVLRVLMIAIRGLSMNDIDILKILPSLTALTLHVPTAPAERITIKEGGFTVLTHFKFMCAAVPSLYFELGAMPHVQKLKLGFDLHKLNARSLKAAGLCNLAGLIEISIKFGTSHVDESSRKAAESALEVAINKHPNTLIVRLQLVDVIFGGQRYKSMVNEETAINEQEDMTLKKRCDIQQGVKRTGNETVDTREHHAQPVDHMLGAMGSLLPKLTELLLEEYNLQKGVKGIKSLRDELMIIEATLVKVSNVPLDQLDPLIKIWANNVRELSYAIEDRLDSFMVGVEGLEPENPHIFLEFIKKSCKKVTKLKIHHEIAIDINDVKIQVKEVKERYDRDKGVIGIDKAMDELMELLSEQRDVADNILKTVSITGFGGLGKTTLAKAVYAKLNKKFDCAGFVTVGRNPDIKKVLKDILFEFGVEMYKSASTMDERQHINQLREFLANKRYLIVIDDIWETPTWEIIKCALVDDDTGSRIITTTRICEVAEKVGGVYNIKPLSDDNARELFYTRIYGGKCKSFDVESAKVSDKFLKKCGGVPISIITIASLLVGKPREDWLKVYDSIGFGHKDSEVLLNTLKIQSFSFNDLPSCLKTCLLHLSMFVEHHLIWKDNLIWIWIAEGFVTCEQGLSLFEVGDSYFNQLVNKGMIQLVENRPGKTSVGCRVHGMVLDLIRYFSSQLNFVTIHDELSTCSPSRSGSIRRLAVHKRSSEHSCVSIEMGHLRSFNATLCTDSRLLKLLSFKVLRVLLLDNCNFPAEGCLLEHLGKLVQLRYLGLFHTPVAELPKNIGHDLKYLQTLDVTGSGIKELPPSMGELSKLMCLRASKGTRMLAGIGRLTSLEELKLHSVDKCPNFARELENLTEVTVLDIHFDEIEKSTFKALIESLRNMHKIQSLQIYSEPEGSIFVGSWQDYWVPPSNLRELVLYRICLSRLPPWLSFSCVPHLSYLYIQVNVVEERDLRILGRLPLLRYLRLKNQNEDCLPYTVGIDEFPSLRYFFIYREIMCGSERALPMLEELGCKATVGITVGLVPENMPLLQKVTYFLNCTNCSGEQVEEAEATLRLEAKAHPNRPSLEIEKIITSTTRKKMVDPRRNFPGVGR